MKSESFLSSSWARRIKSMASDSGSQTVTRSVFFSLIVSPKKTPRSPKTRRGQARLSVRRGRQSAASGGFLLTMQLVHSNDAFANAIKRLSRLAVVQIAQRRLSATGSFRNLILRKASSLNFRNNFFPVHVRIIGMPLFVVKWGKWPFRCCLDQESTACQ